MSDVIEQGYPRAGGLRAEEMRTPVDGKSPTAQETRALLTARKLLQAKRHDVEMNLRGVLHGFGLEVGPTTRRSFKDMVRALVEGHPTLETVAEGLLAARAELLRRLKDLGKRLVAVGRCVDPFTPAACADDLASSGLSDVHGIGCA